MRTPLSYFFNSNAILHLGMQYLRNRLRGFEKWKDDFDSPSILIFTVDTELTPDWKVPRKSPSLDQSISGLLSLLDDFRIRGTFLCEGMMIEEYGDLVKTISDSGHEIGYHGYDHESYGGYWPTKTVNQPKVLERDRIGTYLREGKNLIYNACGQNATSFVAPFHLASRCTIKELMKNGFTADASLYNHAFGLSSTPFVIGSLVINLVSDRPNQKRLVEIPFTVPRTLSWRFNPPILEFATKHLQNAIEDCRGMPYILLTVHPWELNPEMLSLIDFFLSGLKFESRTMREVANLMLTLQTSAY